MKDNLTVWFLCPGTDIDKEGCKAVPERLALPRELLLFAAPTELCRRTARAIGGWQHVNVLPELDYDADRYVGIKEMLNRIKMEEQKGQDKKSGKKKRSAEIPHAPLDDLYARMERDLLRSYGKNAWESFISLVMKAPQIVEYALIIADWPYLPTIADASVETFMPRRRIRSAELRPYGGFRIDYPADPEKSPRVLVIPDDLDT